MAAWSPGWTWGESRMLIIVRQLEEAEAVRRPANLEVVVQVVRLQEESLRVLNEFINTEKLDSPFRLHAIAGTDGHVPVAEVSVVQQLTGLQGVDLAAFLLAEEDVAQVPYGPDNAHVFTHPKKSQRQLRSGSPAAEDSHWMT